MAEVVPARPGRTVAVLGALLQDHTIIMDRQPDEGETIIVNSYSSQMGGKGANAAVAVHRLSRLKPGRDHEEADLLHEPEDIHLRLVSAVGGDDLGLSLKKELEGCGVNTDGVRVLKEERTSTGTILVEAETGSNRIMLFPGACGALTAEDFSSPESVGGGMKPDFIIAQLEINRDAIEQAIETASNVGIEILLNPAPARYLDRSIYKMIKHLVMNETEAKVLSNSTDGDIQSPNFLEDTCIYFHKLGVPNVVITLGEKGAYYSSKEGAKASVEAETDCAVVDTSGAGYVSIEAFFFIE